MTPTKTAKKKISRSNEQKNNFASAAHSIAHFFAAVLQDFNVKLPETS